jgi:aerobic C4-dicarboxylate transport protein
MVGLVMPTGYSFYQDRISIYLPLSVLFIAQVFGVPLSFGQLTQLLIVLMVTSKGAAGVTGSGFIIPAGRYRRAAFFRSKGSPVARGRTLHV